MGTFFTGEAAQKSQAIFQLAEIFDKELEQVKIKSLFADIEMPLSIVLAEMEFRL